MSGKYLLPALAMAAIGCSTLPKNPPDAVSEAPFSYAGKLLKVPVTIADGRKSHFILDTGIGVNLISEELCAELACKIDSQYEGKRMSGQKIKVSMAEVSKLSIAGHQQSRAPVGVWPMKGFLPPLPEFANVEGFVSLGFFRHQAFTLDYRKMRLTIENEQSLAERLKRGVAVPIEIKEQGPEVVVFMKLDIPGKKGLRVELDLGSNILILDDRYMEVLKIDPNSDSVRREERKDETQHPYVRHFTKLSQSIALGQDSAFKQDAPAVMFQKIIYDGLLGNDFMKRFIVTYDLPHQRLIFEKAAETDSVAQ